MGVDWTYMPLGEFVTLQRGHDLPAVDRRRGPVPVLGSFGITGWHDKARARGPGVTVGRSGASFGVVSYSTSDFWPLNTALYVADFHGNDERFAYYFLKQFDFKRYNSGSAQPSLNRNYVHPVRVQVPPKSEQRAIAYILGTLDVKIELNQRLNETLEEIARALFKSWFVDFDPVRAETEGNVPSLASQIASLFPHRFADSLRGEIPDGWGVADLYWCAEVIYGAPFKSALFNDLQRGLPLIRIRDLKHQEPTVWTTEKNLRGHLVSPGDLLVGMDGEFRAYLWHGPAAWLNQRVCCVKPLDSIPQAFIRFSLEEPLDFYERSKTGTTVIHLGKGDIDAIRIVQPPLHVLKAFAAITNPIDARIVSASAESRTLAALRDTLLPKLISGELRIKDAEHLVSEVV